MTDPEYRAYRRSYKRAYYAANAERLRRRERARLTDKVLAKFFVGLKTLKTTSKDKRK